MKTFSLMTALALLAAPVLIARPSVAAEGGRDPFALTTPGITTTLRAGTVGSIDNPFPYAAPPTVERLATTPESGSEAGYNSANSLPAAPRVPGPARSQVARR